MFFLMHPRKKEKKPVLVLTKDQIIEALPIIRHAIVISDEAYLTVDEQGFVLTIKCDLETLVTIEDLKG